MKKCYCMILTILILICATSCGNTEPTIELTTVCGVDQKDIDALRTIMLQ